MMPATLRLLTIGCAVSFLFAASGLCAGQDATGLTVREIVVFRASAYQNTLNSRELFQSTLPGFMLSQRPSASRREKPVPTPVGLMTFSGSAGQKVDVLLEFQGGRFLAHWPPASKRSTRLMWRSVNLGPDQVRLVNLPKGHWLEPLREADRLYLQHEERSERFLLYDAEVSHSPSLKVSWTDGKYRVSNGGTHAVHDLMICKPVEHQWRVAGIARIDGTGKPAETSNSPEEADPEAVFDSPAQPAEAARDADRPSDPSPAATSEAPQPAAVPANDTGSAAEVVVKAPSTAQSEATEETAATEPAGTEVPFLSESPESAARILERWSLQLTAVGLEQSEIEHALRILEHQALDSRRTLVVFRLDPETLDAILPLEVTPLPHRTLRVGLVILQDADPETEAEIDALVAQLGDRDWARRESASARLRALAAAAKPKLEEALNNQDAEIAFRAEQLLEELQKPASQ